MSWMVLFPQNWNSGHLKPNFHPSRSSLPSVLGHSPTAARTDRMDLSAKWNMLKNVFTTTMYLITTRKKRLKKLPNRTIWGGFVAASSADNSVLPRNPFPECRKCLTFQIIINHHINTVQICTTELFLQSGCQDSSSSALGCLLSEQQPGHKAVYCKPAPTAGGSSNRQKDF